MNEAEFPVLIRELYAIVGRLTAMFPGRHFTPDGHLVGSIGEALAKHYYGVQLVPASTQGYDGTRDGKKVEVKVTQGAAVALSSSPEHLLVFRLLPDGSFEEHYNGPGGPVWELLTNRKPTKNGQQQVRLTVLRSLMTQLDVAQVLEPVCPLPPGTKRNPSAADNAAQPTLPANSGSNSDRFSSTIW